MNVPVREKNPVHIYKQELKKKFQAFIINHGVSISKQVIYNNKLHVFLLMLRWNFGLQFVWDRGSIINGIKLIILCMH
jgi:hypothetical protein